MSVTQSNVETAPEDVANRLDVSLPEVGGAHELDRSVSPALPLDNVPRDTTTSAAPAPSPTSRRYMLIFERATGIIGVLCLVTGLSLWAFQPGDHRSALVVLVCAMFLAILHYYSLEDTRNGHAGSNNQRQQ